MNQTCSVPNGSSIDALQSYLSRVAADTRSRSVVVSDDDGLVICGYGADDRQAAIAAWSAAPEAARRAASVVLEEAGIEGPLHVTPIDWGGIRLRLTSDGTRPPSAGSH